MPLTLPPKDKYVVGVISDTHGLMRAEALDALRGAELIIHAGDIGKPEVLDALGRVAPTVVAVRGNNDGGAWARAIAETETIEIGEVRLYLLHALQELALDPSACGFDLVVSGHSHRPSVARRDGVLYLNPGSAGPRRFKLPVSVARLTVRGKSCRARIVELNV
ncbi:MAG TPA: metallophosphoesterase family protein [Pyrinomonadaceae bacterium]|nr:metallophosphoesterase family protein [Pyrinomonadaceae bacterium]